MKRIFILLLAIQLFSSHHFLPELMKMPELLRHFQEHIVENNDLNFFSFLKMHYANPEHQEKDAQRHGNLPLKSDQCVHFHDFVKMRFPFLPPSVSAPFLVPFIEKNKPACGKNLFFDADIHFSIFQPPRFS